MNRRLRALCLALCVFAAGAGAQSYLYPLEVPTDARSVAMGESFVALPGEVTALMSNPAGLAGVRGFGVSYSQRSMDWTRGLEDFRYHGVNAYAAFPFGVFGAQYNRFSMGDLLITTSESPDGVGTASTYEHSFALGFGSQVCEHVTLGIAAKLFDIAFDYSGTGSSRLTEPSVTPAYLLDGGMQFVLPLSATDSVLRHTVAAGISLQNIGSDLKMKHFTEQEHESADEMPRYLRVGLSYRLDVWSQVPDDLQPVSAVITGEYRRLLNSWGGGTSNVDYWGCGVECTVLEILSIRVGGVVMPFTSIYGDKGKFMTRSGIGVRVPLSRLGLSFPLVVSGGYAHIPINSHPNNFMWGNTDHLSAFSIQVEYRPE